MSSTSVVGLDATICWQTWYSTCRTACVMVSNCHHKIAMLTTYFVQQDVLKLLQNSKLDLLVLSLQGCQECQLHTYTVLQNKCTALIKTL